MAGRIITVNWKGLLKPEEIVTHYMPFEEAAGDMRFSKNVKRSAVR